MKKLFTNEVWLDNRLHDITLMGGGDVPSSTQSTTASTTAPWEGQQPYLVDAMHQAQALNQTAGPQYYPGSTVAAPSNATQQAQQMEMNFGSQPQPTITAAQSAMQNILSPGYTTANQGNAMFGQVYNNSANPALAQAQNLATNGTPGQAALTGIANSGAPNLAQGYLGSVANGSQIGNNPTLNAQWQAASNDITNAYQTAIAPQISSSMESAGRFGSGAADNATGQGERQLASQLATAGSTLYGNAYNQATQNQLNAASTIQQAATANTGQQVQAANAAGQNALGATATFGQLGQQGLQNQLAAASGLSTNISNDSLSQIKGLAAAPSIANLPLTQAGAVADVGSQQNQYQQALLNNQVAAYNFGQTQPYQNLATYESLINGNYGGQSTQTSPYYYGSNSALLGNMATAAGLGASISNSGWGATAGLLPLITG